MARLGMVLGWWRKWASQLWFVTHCTKPDTGISEPKVSFVYPCFINHKMFINHIWKMVLLCGLWVRFFLFFKKLAGNLGYNFSRWKLVDVVDVKKAWGSGHLHRCSQWSSKGCTKSFRKFSRTKHILQCIVGSIAAILLTKFAHFLPPLTFMTVVLIHLYLLKFLMGKEGWKMAYVCMHASCAFFSYYLKKYFSRFLFN